MHPIAKTFINLGPASTEYQPRDHAKELRHLHEEETASVIESEPDENERTDYSYDPEDDIIEMHLGKKMEKITKTEFHPWFIRLL